MKNTIPSTLRVLVLLLTLVIGPLQAQDVFACSMMDTEMLGHCCCDMHKADDACDGAHNASTGPCCDVSVAVSMDDEARQNTPIVKPAEVNSDVDPPQVLVAAIDSTLPPQTVALPVLFQLPVDVRRSGSDTYLITQRLRI